MSKEMRLPRRRPNRRCCLPAAILRAAALAPQLRSPSRGALFITLNGSDSGSRYHGVWPVAILAHPVRICVRRRPDNQTIRKRFGTLRILAARGKHSKASFQSSKKACSSLIPYWDARMLVRNTLPAVSISAPIRVSVVIRGSTYQPTPPRPRLQGR
jgi:hypothetical protein